MQLIFHIILGAGLLLCMPSAWAESRQAERPVILNITERREGYIPSEFGRGALSRRMPLFMDELDVPEAHIFEALWRPPDGGMPAGVVVLFEYRQPHEEGVSRMFVEYNEEVFKDQIARFVLPGESVRRSGPVTAWRLRIMHSGRTLVQHVAETWR